MTREGGLDLALAMAGTILVVTTVGLNVRRFQRVHLGYHIQSSTWAFFLVASDLLHIGIHESVLEGWAWSALFFVCLILFVVTQAGGLRMGFGSWSGFALEAWIVGTAAILAAWAVAGLVGYSQSVSPLDVAHVTVTAWMAGCVIRQLKASPFAALGWWSASVGIRCVAILGLVSHHLSEGSRLETLPYVLLALSYLLALPSIWRNVGVGVDERRPGLFWQANNLPYVVVMIAVPLIAYGLTIDDNADDLLYVGLAASIGITLALRTMLAAGLNQSLIDELAERGEQLHDLAYNDPLTGLVNRNRFVAKVSEVMDDDLVDGTAPGPHVLFIDLDGFKRVNDAAGHAAGDSVLRDVAARLRQSTPRGSELGRLGGDEFVVLLHETSLEQAERVASNVVDAISAPYSIHHGSFVIGASIGISAARQADDAEDVLRHSDLAMYAAKNDHRPWAVYASHMHDSAVRRADDDRMFSAVLNDGRMELRYQPIVDLESGSVQSCEALLRWRSPDGELRGPTGLLEFAERSGQMSTLSRWTLGAALNQATELRDRLGGLSVSVNLAPVDLLRPGLVSVLRDELGSRQLSPSMLTLEITEQALIEEPDRVIRIISDLRSSHIRVAIDDFGTGFSSLAYLVDLPVDVIKLDRSFIHSLPRHSPARIVIAGVVGIADQLGLELVAEGVESAEQADLLLGLGCRLCQGSYFYEPMTGDELAMVAATAPASR